MGGCWVGDDIDILPKAESGEFMKSSRSWDSGSGEDTRKEKSEKGN